MTEQYLRNYAVLSEAVAEARTDGAGLRGGDAARREEAGAAGAPRQGVPRARAAGGAQHAADALRHPVHEAAPAAAATAAAASPQAAFLRGTIQLHSRLR